MSWKTAVAVLVVAALTVLSAFAQVKADGKPTSAAQDFLKEAYVIEKLHTQVVEEADGSGTREHTAEIKILADAGVKTFAVLNFTYTSANETVDVDYVRVRKPDGTVVKTPAYNVQDMPADVTRIAPLYSDVHEKHVAVKGLSVGDVLEYVVRYRVVKPEVPGQFWFEHSFTKHAIVKDERLELSVPADKYVKVVSPDFKPEVKDAAGRRIYTWTHSNLEVKEKDPNEIPRRVPPNPSVQVTTFKTWEDIGRWYGGLQTEPLEVTPAIRAKAAELTKGLKSDDDKIRALYAFVSLQFHYIGLDFGIGRYQPHAADDVLGNGYGDCKDKHTLLASLLKAAGIDAWPVLIHATRKLDPDVPSPAQFNHVITVVPRGDELIWLDTTPEVAPYRLLLLTLRDKQALVIPSNKAPLLMTTPENPPFPMEQEFSSSGKLNSDGIYTGHIEQSYRGDAEVMLRAAFRQLSESQWKDAVQRFSYGLSFGGDVSNVKVSPPNELDKPFQISYDYVRKNFADWDDQNTSAALPPMGVEVPKDAKEKKPQEPVVLGMLGKIVYRSRMELPSGYSVVPRGRSHEAESFAEYTADTAVENGVLTVSRELILKKSQVQLSDWETYRRFGRAVSDDEFAFMPLNRSGGERVTITKNGGSTKDKTDDRGDVDENFRRATTALQRRDNQRAQELLEKVVGTQPKYKGAHFELGIALLSQNKVSEALAEFHKEQEISPDDVRAYQAPAVYLNATGHKEDAIQEWRKLLKADPANHNAAVTLGQLLYQTKKYPEAAEMLETALKSSPENSGVQSMLGQAYLKAGQTDKGVTHLKAAAEEKDDPAVLNDVAYTLAENKVELALAQQYAEKAVKGLDE
jgi:tetratricopeptide (TPR) repeat protein/transglutaminase-like putative cysteine protease